MQRTIVHLLLTAGVSLVLVILALKLLPAGWILPGAARGPVAVDADRIPQPTSTTSALPSLPAQPQVVALARLEPLGGVVNVGGTTGDRVARLLVADGQEVTAGQELAQLESYAVRKAQHVQAELALSEARERLKLERTYGETLVNEAQIGIEHAELQALDIKVQEARLEVLAATLDVAQRDLQRLTALDESIIPQQQREHQRLVVEKAKAELDAAQATIDRIKQTQAFGVRQAQERARAAAVGRDRLIGAVQLESLEQAVRLAEAQLNLSRISAPIDGRVLQILTRPGETIGQLPVLRLGNTRQMEAVAEVYETDVAHVRPGQTVRITSDALGRPLSGRVSYVGSMVGRNEILSLDPTRSTDLRVIEVRIMLDEADAELAARFIRLQVRVTIDTGNPAP